MSETRSIIRRLRSKDSQVVINQLGRIEEMTSVPTEVQQMILELSQQGDAKPTNLAVICLKKCIDYFAEARAILLKQLKSRTWYIRANAAKSLAYLGASDEDVIELLMSLMGDIEGHDFSPEESAIEALGIIGPKANRAVPLLIGMAHKELDDGPWETMLILLFEALVKIDSGSPQFIELLIRAVKTCQSVGISNALRHLTTFKDQSMAVLPLLEPYVNQELWLEADFMTDESDELVLLKALYFIGGHQHPMLKTYLHNLKSNDYQPGRVEALAFEKSWLNHL
jgi:hypothetical protein